MYEQSCTLHGTPLLMKKFVLLTSTLIYSLTSVAQGLVLSMPSATETGPVCIDNTTIYFKAKKVFTQDSTSSYGAFIDDWSGNVIGNRDKPNGPVRKVISDGAGGFFVAGNFTTYGDSARAGLAHVNALGTVSDKLSGLGVNGTIRSLCLYNNMLYIGGDFTLIGGVVRNRLAAVNIITNTLTSFNPNVNGSIYSIAIENGMLYLGGSFSTVSALSRSGLASIDLSTQAVTSWSPNPNSTVGIIYPFSNRIYVGGNFTNINGTSRSRLAAFLSADGSLIPWNPTAANGDVSDLIPIDDRVYVVGSFNSKILSLDSVTGIARSWNHSNMPAKLNTICSFNNKLYVGGMMNSYQSALYKIDPSLSSPPSIPVNTGGYINNEVYTVCSDGSSIYVGGAFTLIGGLTRNGLGIMDSQTGIVSTIGFETNGLIYAIKQDANYVYIAGAFTTVNGQARSRIAQISKSSLLLTSWNPITTGTSIRAMTVLNNTLYIGGEFTAINGQPRGNLAAFDLSNGTLNSWNPMSSGPINNINGDGNNIYVCGNFVTSIGGQPRINFAELDATTGLATSWNPSISSAQSTLIFGNRIIVSGLFTSVNSQPRNYIAAFNLTSKTLLPWNPNPNRPIYDGMCLFGDKLVVGSEFTTIGGVSRGRLAAVDTASNFVYPWNPGLPVNSSVSNILTDGTSLFVTGSFNMISGHEKPGFAVFNVSQILPVSFIDFYANKEDNIVHLFWQTGNEINNERFEVERSFNNQDYIKIGEQKGAGTTNQITEYSFTDYTYDEQQGTFKTPVIYYRIKQINFDGTFLYSKTVALELSRSILQVFPNPCVSQVNIKGAGLSCELYDLTGQKLQTLKEGVNDISALLPGIYFIVSGNQVFKLITF